jgi:hypothetical protein
LEEGEAGNLIGGIAEKEEQPEEVIEIVLGVASGDYAGSIYEVNNGPPVEDHPFGNVVVEMLDDNDAIPAAFENIPPPPDDNDAAIMENIPPPPNQVRFSRNTIHTHTTSVGN